LHVSSGPSVRVGFGCVAPAGYEVETMPIATGAVIIRRQLICDAASACATKPTGVTRGNRWGILAVLFAVRNTIAFQFQSVAAVALLDEQIRRQPRRYRC
jgi:hypothetical protein